MAYPCRVDLVRFPDNIGGRYGFLAVRLWGSDWPGPEAAQGGHYESEQKSGRFSVRHIEPSEPSVAGSQWSHKI